MPLLDIKATKKLTILCTLEDSTVLMVNQYSAFAQGSPDEIVNKALEYAFSKDAEFQKFRSANSTVPSVVRVKRGSSNGAGARRGPKPGKTATAV